MSEINTTSIDDLPSDPVNGGNVSLVVTEQQSQQPPSMTLDDKTISQIVNGLQQAHMAGATSLPSRDIPLQTEQLTRDEQVMPNYVPQPQPHAQFVEDDDDDIKQYYAKQHRNSSLDELYDELQAPLLLAFLYFLFQLPFFKKLVYQYLPFLCGTDGNYNFNGLVFTCAFFGFVYYSLHKMVKHFSKF